MFEIYFLFAIALLWIIFATVQDLKTKEIANWLNFSLIIFALGFRFFYSLFYGNFNFLYQGLIGLGIFFVLGNVFYYGKLFAGGDAKLLIALGPILPISLNFLYNLQILLFFLLTFLISGAVYGIIVSIFLCSRNFKKFKTEFKTQIKKNKNFIVLILIFGIIFFFLGFYIDSMFFFLSGIAIIFSLFYPYAKSVDEASMVREVYPSLLKEGDWLYSDVKVGKKIIRADWQGLTESDIRILRKNKRKILIREGVVFTPVFLVAFLLFFYFLNKGLWYPFW